MFNVIKLRSICLRNYTIFINNNINYRENNIPIRTYKTTSRNPNDNMAAKVVVAQGQTTSSTSITDDTKKLNRLSKEKSPYLLQHATNPVDWYPWSDEAIDKARKENKLIFLSVGYSTCHWCHVMEHESFENDEVAKIMNENYINIKVDREERPDIDKIYMTFVVMTNGSGGWPMSVWLTPDLAPITAGTYFPPENRWGMPGFKTVLTSIQEKWKTNGPELMRTGKSIITALKKSASERDDEGESLNPEGKFNQAIAIYKRNFDEEWGGWGKQPKFPEVSKLNFLLHAHFKKSDANIADMVLITLTKIANGGIHDHIFGGFARYSVDRKWHIPHFEKMLYDQGQLLVAYSNAYRLTKNQFYLNVCENIIKYLCKDLKHPNGGFFAGEDADSLPTHNDKIKIEGAFYAWDYNEIKNAFKKENSKFKEFNLKDDKIFDIYKYHYSLNDNGNVERSSDPHNHLLKKNIHFVKGSIEETSEKMKIDKKIIEKILNIGNEILYDIRCKRPRPHLDTKIICAWNGLVLSGLSKLCCICDTDKRNEYLDIAKKLVKFIRENLYDEKEKILYRSCYGEGVNNDKMSNISEPIKGFLDDYAFLIKGLLDYYVATLDGNILKWANELQQMQDKLFWDNNKNGYFYSQENQSNVIVRLKDDHDGAEPCGNSMSVHNLMYLNTYYENTNFKERAKKILDYYDNTNPFGYVLPHMMSGLLLYDFGIEMLVVVGPDNDESRKLFNVTKNFFIPGLIPIHVNVNKPDDLVRKSASQFKMIRDLPTVYICHNQVCQLPITDPVELEASLKEKYIYKCDI